MLEVRPEVDRRLQQVTDILITWHDSPEHDKRDFSLRRREMVIGSTVLEELMDDLRPLQHLRLKVGEVPARAARFSKNAYQFEELTSNKLEPGSELDLLLAQKRDITGQPGPELYVGDYSLSIAVSSLARTLSEGSKLLVAES
jgi:hypothetical protein